MAEMIEKFFLGAEGTEKLIERVREEIVQRSQEVLEEAKISGAFDGEDGKRGFSIHYYRDDHISAVPGDEETESYEIDVDASSVQIDDLILGSNYDIYQVKSFVEVGIAHCERLFSVKGTDGQPGATPVKGTDYWTDADKAEIKSYVDDAILGGAW